MQRLLNQVELTFHVRIHYYVYKKHIFSQKKIIYFHLRNTLIELFGEKHFNKRKPLKCYNQFIIQSIYFVNKHQINEIIISAL